MKTHFLCLIVLNGLLFLSCGPSKKDAAISNAFLLDNDKVELIDYVSFQKQITEKEQSKPDYYIEIYPAQNGKTVALKTIYFRGLKSEITIGKKTYVSYLKEKTARDIKLSSDSSNEYENTLPITPKLPFLLNDSECVISYIDNDTVKFIKVFNLKELPLL